MPGDPCVDVSGVTVALCVLTLLLVALRGRRAPHHRPRPQPERPRAPPPPGPTPWPLVGNLLQMGSQTHLSLTRLRLQYGDVFQVILELLHVSCVVGVCLCMHFAL